MVNEACRFDLLVIGGGTCGASTALALKKRWPEKTIGWVAGTHKFTASNDINKIVRTAYVDGDYREWADITLEDWRSKQPYCKYFHPCGWVQVISEDSYRSKMKGQGDKKISAADLSHSIGSREIPIINKGEELWRNDTVGYVECQEAIRDVAKAAALLGVARIEVNITKLIVEENVCKGAQLDNGSIVTANQVIMATGPWTPGLLEKSGISFPDDFFTITAVPVATLGLVGDEYKKLKRMPILVTGNGEVMPPLPKPEIIKPETIIKITSTETFEVEHPNKLDYDGPHDISSNRAVLDKMLPQFTKRQLNSSVCCDIMTPFQHPLLDAAIETEHLLIVTGGNYHMHKFLPVIGDMVVLWLEGKPDNTLGWRLLKRWTWDRAQETVSVHPSVVPKKSHKFTEQAALSEK